MNDVLEKSLYAYTGRLDLKLQEIVKFEDGWLLRLLGLANEWVLDALPGE